MVSPGLRFFGALSGRLLVLPPSARWIVLIFPLFPFFFLFLFRCSFGPLRLLGAERSRAGFARLRPGTEGARREAAGERSSARGAQ